MKTTYYQPTKMAKVLSIAIVSFILNLNQLKAQIINGGFESNSTGTPIGWSLGGQFGSGIDTLSARSGNNSLSVWNWYYYSPGYAVNGNLPLFSTDYHLAGTPVSGKPASLDGYYRYDSTNTNSSFDSAMVWVLLKKFNVALHKVDTVGFGTKRLGHVAGNAYEPFQVIIQDLMPGVMPDSVVIFFQSAMGGFCGSSTTGNCLYLNVDDLAFDTPATLKESKKNSELFSFYPNPAKGELFFNNVSGNPLLVKIINTSGAMVFEEQMNVGNKTLSVGNLSPGFYVLQVSDHQGNLSNKKLLLE